MTDQHPITPPPELALQWINEYLNEHPEGLNVEVLVVSAAQWGADQELEACCEWFQEFYKTESWVKHDLKHFRAARRPKPPSLKKQALKALEDDDIDVYLIRRALEALPND